MNTEQKVRAFEKKILGHFDASCQAVDLTEIMDVGFNEQDRLLCWNAAMNLVEQERVHLLQITEKQNPSTCRWILIGYAFKILNNKVFRPPGNLQ